jgi:hypothetical protein
VPVFFRCVAGPSLLTVCPSLNFLRTGIKSRPPIRDIKKASDNAAICIGNVKGNSKYFLPLNPLYLLTD